MTHAALAGRTVAVTGGANGIGEQIARTLAAAGAHVAIGDRDLDRARTVAGELGNAVALELDVTDRSSFETFLHAAAEELGALDVLVNNAGVMWVGPFDQEPESAARRQIEVNLLGVIHGVQLTAPAMRVRGHGHILTIASASSLVSAPGEATYAATKHGVLGYLKAAREELRGSGVLVSAVLPGVVDTRLAAGTGTGAARLLSPSDVAEAVRGVLERPRFITTVPSTVGLLDRVLALLPQTLRDHLLRRVVPDQVAAVRGRSDRRDYESGALG